MCPYMSIVPCIICIHKYKWIIYTYVFIYMIACCKNYIHVCTYMATASTVMPAAAALSEMGERSIHIDFFLCIALWIHLLYSPMDLFFTAPCISYIFIYIYISIAKIHTYGSVYFIAPCIADTYIYVYIQYSVPDSATMGWLRLVGSLKLKFSFAKEPYKRDCILQMRPIILRSLLFVATTYM